MFRAKRKRDDDDEASSNEDHLVSSAQPVAKKQKLQDNQAKNLLSQLLAQHPQTFRFISVLAIFEFYGRSVVFQCSQIAKNLKELNQENTVGAELL